jgi:hypothetical protein
MANEITVNCALNITAGNLKFRSQPTSFRADITAGAMGPSPGAFTAALAGTHVDFSALTTPGMCVIRNFDTANYVMVGIHDGTEFYPLLELLPGEAYALRLSRYIGRSVGTGVAGTAAYDGGTYTLMVKSTVAPCKVSVEAFDK